MFFTDLTASKKPPVKKWETLIKNQSFAVSPYPFEVNQDVLCIGSCFAENIRLALEKRNLKCYPDLKRIGRTAHHNNHQALIDQRRLMIDSAFQGRDHMNFYTPAAILQEVNRALAYLELQPDERLHDFKSVDDYALPSYRSRWRVSVFQDPSRRLVYAEHKEVLFGYSQLITKCMADALKSAKIIVITFGLIEQFYRDVKNKRLFYNQHPFYYGLNLSKDAFKSTKLILCDYESAFFDINLTVSLLRQITSVPIVFSVSPVPLERTFRDNSNVFEANLRSKSTLLLAVRDVVDKCENTYYFPSYEIVTSLGAQAFDPSDLRHVRQELVIRSSTSF